VTLKKRSDNYKLNFIDIHCHILPGMDDGPSNMDESLKMVKIAEEDGISDIFATPHILPGTYDNRKNEILAAVERLRNLAPEAVSISCGADVRVAVDLLDRVESGEVPTLNDTGYMLIEMPDYVVPPNVDNLIFNLRHKGVIPIITHPERHLRLMHDLSALTRLRDSGALCQITAMSITGGFGKGLRKVSMEMIRRGLVDFVASDAHDIRNRRPILSRAYEEVKKEFGSGISDMLFFANPKKIIEAAKVPSSL
jgi:protein-tyrosine phosphatase